MDLYIEDGYTAHKTVPAVAGLHPPLDVEYRPALARERHAYARKLGSADPDQLAQHETDLICKHVVTLNGAGDVRQKEKVARLRPAVRAHLIDLILGYAAEDEAADAKN